MIRKCFLKEQDEEPSMQGKVAEENKTDKPKKMKRTTHTTRLQNSLKLSRQLLDSLEVRTNKLNLFYNAKMDYLNHKKSMKSKNRKSRANDLKQELLNEVKAIKTLLYEFV